MKHSALPLLLAAIVISGCATRMNADVLQARIREQSLQLTESQREIAKARSELKQARLETERLRSELGQTNHNVDSTSRSDAQISKVHIYSLLSGGINRDDQPGDDAVVVQFAPFDRDNEPVKVPGEVELTLIDPQLPPNEQTLGHWNFTEEECQNQWTRGLASSGFQFTLPLEEPAQHADLIVQLSFTAADDRQFEANRRVKVGIPPANAVVRNPRQKKKPVQVVEELDDDLPPVGDSSATDDDAEFLETDVEDDRPPQKSATRILHSANWTDSTIPQYR